MSEFSSQIVHNLSTSAQYDRVAEALIYLSSRCNFASSLDGQGFNSFDALDCNNWAAKVRSPQGLSPLEAHEAYRRLKKYWRQLKDGGIVLPKTWKCEYAASKVQADVWLVENLSRGSSYEVDVTQDADELLLLCSCQAAECGAECGHVRFLRKHLLDQSLQLEVETAAKAEVARESAIALETQTEPKSEATEPIQVGGIQLTQQQTQALLGLEEWLNTPGDTYALLSGYAGTGKTCVLQAMLKRMRERRDRRSVVFTAFSNKATQVLSSMAYSWGLNVDCMTCCKLLGLRPVVDPVDGSQSFQPEYGEKSKAEEYELIVVDECSMIGEEMWEHLSSAIGGLLANTKMLFVGDPAQLNPVGEKRSPSFDNILNAFHLNEVVRYEGAIAAWAEQVRNNPNRTQYPDFKTELTADHSKGVITCDRDRWQQTLIRAFQSEAYCKNPDAVRAIAYTNARVLELNRLIKTALHGEDCPQHFPGQRLIAQEPCMEGKTVLWPTSSEGEVSECYLSSSFAFGENWRVWRLTVIDSFQKVPVTLRSLHAEELPKFQARLKQLGEKKRWQEFWQLKQLFHELRDAYCLTAHKSQGSTFKDVFVDLPNFKQCRSVQERNRLLYVAMTRPTHRVFFLV